MKDAISAFMDGELEERTARRLIDTLARDPEALDTWRTYHLISDSMRDTLLLQLGFTERLARRLASEPSRHTRSRRVPGGARTWYGVAAGMGGVALVGWLAFAPQNPPHPAQFAKAGAPAVQKLAKPSAPQVVPLPKETNDYLLAHEGYSPRVLLQGMAPYVRTVSQPAEELRK